jgi:hypothetical protein
MALELDQGTLLYLQVCTPSLQARSCQLTCLQSYPYPALLVDTTRTISWHVRDITWGNLSWNALSTGRTLGGILKSEVFDSFWSWVDAGTETVYELQIDRPLVVLRLIRVPWRSNLSIITSLTPGLEFTPQLPSYSISTPSHTPAVQVRSLTEPSVIDCATLLANTDWAATSLGPRKTWSPVLDTMISIVMRSPTQDALWLGSESIMI